MFKVNKTHPGGPGKRDCKQIKVDSSAIIKHNYNTQRGDSGTPLIIQPDKNINQCYLIAIHYGKVANYSGTQDNKAIKITSKIIEQLALF